MRGVLKKTAIIFACVIAAFTFVTAAVGLYFTFTEKSEGEAGRISVTGEEPAAVKSTEVPSREDMLENALKSVVGISSAESSSNITSESTWYMGSGVIASSDGYIITNHHVIGARPQRIVVTLYNGETIEGKTIWSDSSLDLAVVKIDGNGYATSPLGDAKKLRVGENIIAIGNPLSMQFQRTVTAGIVSALGRSISIESDGRNVYMEDLIQTDASINPGNSGGPLMNSVGEVVGINTIKVSTAEGMGFAVPVNLCKYVIERLRSVGEFKTPYLGLYAYTAAAARYMHEDLDIKEGLYIARIDEAGPAFAAGLRYGDIIERVNSNSVNTMLELREELYARQGGETIQIEFRRSGTLRKVDVMLSSK